MRANELSNMALLPAKLHKRDYLQMALRDRLSFLQHGHATIGGHVMSYPHWPYFYGIFYEIFIEDNYRIDGLKNVRKIVDAGANIGVSAVYFAQRYPGAHIDCFEPNPEALSYLRKNVESYSMVEVHPYALGEREGEVSFFVDAQIKGSSIAGTYDLFGRKHRESKQIRVPMKTLSSYIIGPVDILKIDVEGGESAILTDLIGTGAIKEVRNLLMEFHFDPTELPHSFTTLLELLEAQGFFVYIRKGAGVTIAAPVLHSYMLFAFRNPTR